MQPSNEVKIRIWRSQRENEKQVPAKVAAIKIGITKEEASVGHASIGTREDISYLSHWPANGVGLEDKKISVTASSQNPNRPPRTPALDEYAEGRQLSDGRRLPRKPDCVESFFSLDKEAIEEEIKAQQRQPYRAIDKIDPKFGKPKEGSNCAGSTYRVLEKGGINELSSVCAALKKRGLFAITPNDLEACILDAKREELKRYPETKEFALTQANSSPSGCTIS
jgi:hypothetical protein